MFHLAKFILQLLVAKASVRADLCSQDLQSVQPQSHDAVIMGVLGSLNPNSGKGVKTLADLLKIEESFKKN